MELRTIFLKMNFFLHKELTETMMKISVFLFFKTRMHLHKFLNPIAVKSPPTPRLRRARPTGSGTAILQLRFINYCTPCAGRRLETESGRKLYRE
jgi:hypothetical protein